MKILSLDVSGNYSSISLLNGDEVTSFTQTHERKDRPDWDTLFANIEFDSKNDLDNLSAIAFARGPGSYTALRITASFLKAIAEVKNIPLIAVSSLESIAKEASHWIDKSEAKILVTIAADPTESYFCGFKKNSNGIEVITEESVMQMGELSEFLTDENCYFAGTGWPLELKNSTNFLSQVIGSAEPVALIAKEKLETNKIFLPENANPIYLKTPEYKKS